MITEPEILRKGKKKIRYICTYSLIVNTKAEDVYVDIKKDVETRFDTWKYELKSALPKWKNKKVTWLIKDELSEKVMAELPALRQKQYC